MEAMKIRHHSRLLRFRRPFGAVEAGESVFLSVFSEDPGVEVTLRLWVENGERVLHGVRNGAHMEFSFTPGRTGLIWYYFILRKGHEVSYYGGKSGEGALYGYPPPAYQITVYEKGYKTPAWFQESIVYQIFPDRFNRGAGSESLKRVAAHAAKGRKTYVHEAWDEPVLSEPLTGMKHYAPVDFYGGDFKGIEEKLPYLKELGVSCIYLNPVFDAASNHRYDTANYLALDPVLGDEAAFLSLVQKAKAQGIRLMFDGVFSHTGDDSVYFDRFSRYGNGAFSNPNSPYRAWYDPQNTGHFNYWWGFETLPEVHELEKSYMEFIAKVLFHWAERGVTSWRLDVADELPDAFIEFLRERLKALDGEGVLLGEVWEDASNKQSFDARRTYADGLGLDSAMGYPFKNAVFDFLLHRTDANGLCERLWSLRENYPKPFYEAQLNLLGSHDTVRALTELSGAPHRDALTRAEQGRYRPTEKELQHGRARFMLAATLQMAMPGVPCIYYGDEVGLTGMADPFCRAPYPWGREDQELLQRYRALTGARNASEALKKGASGFAHAGRDAFMILRQCGKSSAIAAVNRGGEPAQVELTAESFLEGPDGGAFTLSERYRDVTGGAAYKTENGALRLLLPPLSGVLLLNL